MSQSQQHHQWLDYFLCANARRPTSFETWAAAQATQAEEIERLKQRITEKDAHIKWLDKSVEGLAFDQLKYVNRISELEQALRDVIAWIDCDTRPTNRDVGTGECSFNDIYESLDKAEEIARKVLEGKP